MKNQKYTLVVRNFVILQLDKIRSCRNCKFFKKESCQKIGKVFKCSQQMKISQNGKGYAQFQRVQERTIYFQMRDKIQFPLKQNKQLPKMCRTKNLKDSDKDGEFVATIRGPIFVERNQYSKWSQQENKQYCEFLKMHLEDHSLACNRRPVGFFKKMAEFLGETRSKQQCRSHHQKFLKQFKNVAQILSHIDKRVSSSSKTSQLLPLSLEISNQGDTPGRFSQKSEDRTEPELLLIDEGSLAVEERDFLFDLESNDISVNLIY